MRSEAFKVLSVFIEEELDELVKFPSTLDFERLKGVEEIETPEFKYNDNTSMNYVQLKSYLGNTKLKNKLKQLGKNLTVPSTGGYNDFYLNFLQDIFNIKIKKTHTFFSYVVLAIDFLNQNTNDCFFNLPGQDTSLLYCVGESIFENNS